MISLIVLFFIHVLHIIECEHIKLDLNISQIMIIECGHIKLNISENGCGPNGMNLDYILRNMDTSTLS